jgi:hypothetical protein
MLLQAKLIAGGFALVTAAAGGAWVAHKLYAADLAIYKVLVQQLSVSVNRQNAAVRAWVAEGEKLQARVKAAEARLPLIETRTLERIKVVHETQPGPAAPCVEVQAWEREDYSKFCSRWQQPPP